MEGEVGRSVPSGSVGAARVFKGALICGDKPGVNQASCKDEILKKRVVVSTSTTIGVDDN